MSDDVTVIEIDLKKKYFLIFDNKLPQAEVERLNHLLRQWINNSSEPFVLMNGVKLRVVEVEKPENDLLEATNAAPAD